MSFDIILKIILFGVALSMDAFAVSITDGLVYTNINKKKGLFIALVFGFMQAIMPLIGYFIVELVGNIAGASASKTAGDIMSLVVTWISFGLLIIIGLKMIIDAIKDMKKPIDKKTLKEFSIKEVLLMGVATSIDALAVGVSLHAGVSTNTTIFLHVVIILLITFIISFLGVFLGKFFDKLFKSRFEITSIIGGCILILLSIWIVISHYVGL